MKRKLQILILSLCSLLIACQKLPSATSTNPNSYLFYLVLAPINPEQAKLSKQLLLNAKENNQVNGETQIIAANNSYTVVELCQRVTPYFLTPGIKITNESSSDTVTREAEKSLKEIIKDPKKCNTNASALVEVSKNLNQVVSEPSNKKIIVFFQAPWSRDEVSDNTLTELTKAMDKLAQSNRVERLILFGVDPNGADRLAMPFHPLREKLRVAKQAEELVEHLKAVHKDYFN